MSVVTREDAERYLLSFAWFREPEKREYVAVSLDRLVTTLNLLPGFSGRERVRVLEIGGMPYVMTVLVRKFCGYDVEVANEPSLDRGAEHNVEVLENDRGERHEIQYKTLNIEHDPWPWPENTFDLVLYCEVIEHLTYDPTHTLVEAHRVLRENRGRLLLSTPNALNYRYLARMVLGRNPYPPYSGYNAYARHNRLFTADELAHLCREVGYQVEDCRVVYDDDYYHPPRLKPLVRAVGRRGWFSNRLDVIYLLAAPNGTGHYTYPDRPPYVIYDDVQAYRWSNVSDIVADPKCLVDGFFPLESWGGGVRWTGPHATALVDVSGHGCAEVTFHTGPAGRGQVRGWIGLSDGDQGVARQAFELPADTWQTVGAQVTTDVRGRLRLEIGVDQPVVPSALDPAADDDRSLGVAVREIAVR